MTYKKILKLIKDDHQIDSLYKSETEHPLRNKKPHLLFSVENPLFEVTRKTTHEDTLNDLRAKGFKVHPLKGKYGGKLENFMMVENPSPAAVKALMQLAKQTGQESVIYSDGNGSHECHYVNGEYDGKHHKGFGTSVPDVAPEDNFSTMEDGTMFSHSFDFGSLHPQNKSVLRQHFRQEKLNKNEDIKKVYIPSNIHKSEHTGKEINLVHYSPNEYLSEISPEHHGKRGIGLETKRGAPEHKLAFFYREGAKPEEVVITGARAKYITKLDKGHRLYDLGEDSENVRFAVKSKANKKTNQPWHIYNDDIHEELKNRGYHGFFNSKSSLPDVVAMFDPMPIQEKVHSRLKQSKDFDAEEFLAASEKDYFGLGSSLKKAAIDLVKGSLQRKIPFNPNDISKEDAISTLDWLRHIGKRDNVPRQEGGARKRALHKLSKLTQVRIDKETGKREFLLHRGMNPYETENYDQGSHIEYPKGTKTSWTPSKDIAASFAKKYKKGRSNKPKSLWIHEDDIHAYLPQFGGLANKALYGENVQSPSPYRNEHEVIVSHTRPHPVAENAKKGTLFDLDTRINQKGDLERRLSSKKQATPSPLVTREEAIANFYRNIKQNKLAPNEKQKPNLKKEEQQELIENPNKNLSNKDRFLFDSKLKDDKGQHKVFYHGTDKNINQFQEGRESFRGMLLSSFPVKSQGHFFGHSPEQASKYGRNVLPVYIRMTNPLLHPELDKKPHVGFGVDSLHPKKERDIADILLAGAEDDKDGNKVIRGLTEDFYIKPHQQKLEKEHEDDKLDHSWIYNFVRSGGLDWEILDNPKSVNRMLQLGYDGTYVHEPHDDEGSSLFVPNGDQIKHIEAKNFDRNERNIYKTLTAGMPAGAPSTLIGGEALQKESLSGKLEQLSISDKVRKKKKYKKHTPKGIKKGERGDWKKEGYKIKASKVHDHGKYRKIHIKAYDKDNNNVGNYIFTHNKDEEFAKPLQSNTFSNHQRKGLASSAYQHAEKKLGVKLKPDESVGSQTSDSNKFWNQPNRPFGKSEKYNRRNPFNKKEEEETDLKKMSRGLPKFKNLPKVTSRPDQEVQNIDTQRQAKIFSRKAATHSAFPQSSIKEEMANQGYSVAKPKTKEYVKAQQHAAKERFGYDLPESQATSVGAVMQGTSIKKPIGFVAGEGNYPTSARRPHEAIHLALDEVGKKYGHKMSRYAEEKMNSLIHPLVQDHLSQHLSKIGYRKGVHHKELITHLYEMLHDPKTRDIMRHTNPEFKNNEREIMYYAKKNWNAIRDFASKLKVGDEQ